MQETITTPALDLGITELEPMEAPGFWSTVGGIAAGIAVGYGAFALGVAVT